MNEIVNGVGSYIVAGAVIVTCAGTVAFWNPAATSKNDTPDFPNHAPGMLLPPGVSQQPAVPPVPAGTAVQIPGGSPLPSVEGTMPPQRRLPGLNTPPARDVPPPSAPRPTLPPDSAPPGVPVGPPPVNQPPPVNPCPVGLRVDPLLGICVSL